MHIELPPQALVRLYSEYDPNYNVIPDCLHLCTEQFRNYVRNMYRGEIEYEPRKDHLLFVGWCISFKEYIDLIHFCNKFDL